MVKRSDWHECKLEDCGEIVSGGTPSTKIPEYWGEDIPWVTPADLSDYTDKYLSRGRKGITKIGLDKSSARLIAKGSVLFSSRAPIGYVAIASNPISTNQGFKNIEPNDAVDSEFLYYYLKSIKQLAERQSSGTTFRELSGKAFSQLPINVAPLPEQRAIVAKIEALFSELDNGVANLKNAQEQLKVYRQAVLKSAFEGKLTEEWRKQQKDLPSANGLLDDIQKEREERAKKDGQKVRKVTPLSPVQIGNLPILPQNWSWSKIYNVAEVSTGVTPLRQKKEYYENGTIPWVTSGALNDVYVSQPSEYITEQALIETRLKIFPKNSLLVALYGEGKTRGKCSELLFDSTTNQAIAAVLQKGIEERIRPYLKLFLIKNYQDIRQKSSGGVQPNLNLSIIGNTVFPMPPLDEQDVIVREVESKFTAAEQLEKVIKEQLVNAGMLRQSILKRAFEGSLLTEEELIITRQAPDWEPAYKLFERITAEKKQRSRQRKSEVQHG